ncbi:hypothetical protein KSP35_05595 [Aquihabitans sp. G128]|uniref:lipoyl protein ligase domain-containing protein n=1 Tax=Aquihabitans sp. G128 TaxID=2849779 RepID=UPI001C23A17E|nr:hypothetical protein [Aquihabitans sp. G128]QXC62280.1 hypothetical protein KSP35_05595 [Aquihabitans sp. G128]
MPVTIGGRWPVARYAGSATEFHERAIPEPAARAVWWFEVTRAAIALGSTQRWDVVDPVAAAAADVEVVRRRSGGGAVWLEPGAVTWIDVILPHDDPRWTDDVSCAALWLGTAWAGALHDLGFRDARVHDGPMVRTPHSGLVCFAGLAPGEVVLGDAKVVGISQRRTRAGARFQCAVLHRWDPEPLVAVLALPAAERHALVVELADAGTGLGAVAPEAIVGALLARLRLHP